MRFLFFAFGMIFVCVNSLAQGMSVNRTGAEAHSSALLDVNDTAHGLLVPRLTLTQRNGIFSPAVGLLIFQTDSIAGFYYYTGSEWTAVGNCNLPSGVNGHVLTLVGSMPTWTAPLLAVGMPYQGGIVAYLLNPNDAGYTPTIQHGLVAAPNDLSTGIHWQCIGASFGIYDVAIGTGQANTTAIVAACGIGSAGYLCDTLTLGGYSDWYLPSKDELNVIYNNRHLVGGFGAFRYWSSSEEIGAGAWQQYFLDGSQQNLDKANTLRVRAVRSF
jgi:hypothetical protein